MIHIGFVLGSFHYFLRTLLIVLNDVVVQIFDLFSTIEISKYCYWIITIIICSQKMKDYIKDFLAPYASLLFVYDIL